MKTFITDEDITVYNVGDVPSDWGTIILDVDPEVVETWKEAAERFFETQQEIKQELEEQAHVMEN